MGGSPGDAASMRRHSWIALSSALSVLGACSLVNAPDDVKLGTGGSGGGGSSSSGGSACSTAADCPVESCHVATCEAGSCKVDAVPNDTPCDDGAACTENDVCAAGVCVAGPTKACPPSGICKVATCDETSGGQCVESDSADGTFCDDADPCTATSECAGGQCVSGPSCTDTQCTIGTCTPGGCMEVPKAQGTVCGVGPCSTGQCNNMGQCVVTPINVGQPCDDGLYCTTGETCNNAAQCVGQPTCTSDNACVTAGCDEATQACTTTSIPDGMACDDGDSCTLGSSCQGGTCTAQSVINQCLDGDACCPAGCALNQDSDCLYWQSGVQQNVPEAALAGWTLCYSGNYGENQPALATVLASCNKAKLLMACRPAGQPTFSLVAMAPRLDVLFDCGQQADCTKQSNGVGWYYSDSWSWGFAPGGQPVNRDSCDYNAGSQTLPNLRLCWHTGEGSMNGGYRCGDNNLFDATWERRVYHAN